LVWNCQLTPCSRNNQRAFRRRKNQLKQAAKEARAAEKYTKPVLLPKPATTGIDPIRKGQTLMSLRPISVYDVAGTGLDIEARRIFHYASTCLWTAFNQRVIEKDDPLAAAMKRLSLTNDLTMRTLLWTAASELEMRSSFPSSRRVMLQQQNLAVAQIQRDLAAGDVSDELVHAIYALTYTRAPSAICKKKELFPCFPYGDFDPPLASLGWLDLVSTLVFVDRHAEAAAKLLEPRGGLWGMQVFELAYNIQLGDLLRNSMTGTKPSFNLCKTYRHILDLQMPMYRSAGTLLDWQLSSETRDLFLDIRCYLRQVELYMAKAQPAVPAERLVAWRNINQHRVLSLSPDQDQLFRLTVLIFSYNVVFPIPYQDVVQHWVLELLFHICKSHSTSEAALWAVVVAAMSSRDEEVLGCLLEKARQFQSALGLATWLDVEAVMTKYLWLASACNAGGQKFWKLVSRSGERGEVNGYKECSLTKVYGLRCSHLTLEK